MKFDELVKKAIELLDQDDELFCEMVDGLDAWDGFADGYKCTEMSELNDYYYGVSATDLIKDLTEDFNINDDYFYFTIYGLESTDDKVGLYRDNTSPEEVFDNLKQNWNHIPYVSNKEFEEVMDEIWEYTDESQE